MNVSTLLRHGLAIGLFALCTALPAAAAEAPDSPLIQAYRQAKQRQDAAAARSALDGWLATGDPAAVAEQALGYRDGWLYPKDLGRAYTLFEQAGAAGNSWALRMQGWMLQEGEGRPQDHAAAMAAFRRAAEAGDPWSKNQMGWYYDKGWSVPVDFVEALRWYTRAAEAGEIVAMNNVGIFYTFGRTGVPVDAEKARYWTEKAAAAGNEAARQRLAAAAPKPRALGQMGGGGEAMDKLFRGALLAAAEMGFKAGQIDNEGRTASLFRSYQGHDVQLMLRVPPRGNMVNGQILVRDDDVRAGFIKLYRQELAKQVGTSIELDGNISGR